LLQNVRLIDHGPIFNDAAVLSPAEYDAWYIHLLPGGRIAQEHSPVCAMDRQAYGKSVTLHDLILNSTVKVWEGDTEQGDHQLPATIKEFIPSFSKGPPSSRMLPIVGRRPCEKA
jgi:hypothetical protein